MSLRNAGNNVHSVREGHGVSHGYHPALHLSKRPIAGDGMQPSPFRIKVTGYAVRLSDRMLMIPLIMQSIVCLRWGEVPQIHPLFELSNHFRSDSDRDIFIGLLQDQRLVSPKRILFRNTVLPDSLPLRAHACLRPERSLAHALRLRFCQRHPYGHSCREFENHPE